MNMENLILIILVIGIGIMAILVIIAISIFHRFTKRVLNAVRTSHLETEKYIEENRNTIVEIVTLEAKKTRKETQEIKTRLSHARKEHNKFEKR